LDPNSKQSDDVPRNPREDFEDWYSQFAPEESEIEAWAQRERSRRQKWASGPTEEEKRDWARRKRWERMVRSGSVPPSFDSPPADPEYCYPSFSQWNDPRHSREVELGLKGLWYAMWSWPGAVWENLVRSGRAWEQKESSLTRPRRVPYEYHGDDF
jgi:hypothetical protein